jgi:hypothetical protein
MDAGALTEAVRRPASCVVELRDGPDGHQDEHGQAPDGGIDPEPASALDLLDRLPASEMVALGGGIWVGVRNPLFGRVRHLNRLLQVESDLHESAPLPLQDGHPGDDRTGPYGMLSSQRVAPGPLTQLLVGRGGVAWKSSEQVWKRAIPSRRSRVAWESDRGSIQCFACP